MMSIYNGRKVDCMTILANRPNIALVVIDMQTAVIEHAFERDRVVTTVAGLVDRARAQRVAVIWVQHADEELVNGSQGWCIVPELAPVDTEPLLEKSYPDSFEGTDLESVLSRLAVGRIVVVGAQTDGCILSTLHGAFVRGYDVTLVGDAHTTEDQTALGASSPDQVIIHTNLYWNGQEAPGRAAATVSSAKISFR
jgi:nicotinamidase-related amidase